MEGVASCKFKMIYDATYVGRARPIFEVGKNENAISRIGVWGWWGVGMGMGCVWKVLGEKREMLSRRGVERDPNEKLEASNY